MNDVRPVAGLSLLCVPQPPRKQNFQDDDVAVRPSMQGLAPVVKALNFIFGMDSLSRSTAAVFSPNVRAYVRRRSKTVPHGPVAIRSIRMQKMTPTAIEFNGTAVAVEHDMSYAMCGRLDQPTLAHPGAKPGTTQWKLTSFTVL